MKNIKDLTQDQKDKLTADIIKGINEECSKPDYKPLSQILFEDKEFQEKMNEVKQKLKDDNIDADFNELKAMQGLLKRQKKEKN